jgi:hypothetical protein
MGLFTVRSMASFASAPYNGFAVFSPIGWTITAGFREPTKCATNPETLSCSCSGIDGLNSARRGGRGRAEVVKRCSAGILSSKPMLLGQSGFGGIAKTVCDTSGATDGKSLSQRRLV